jgi:hypothetical protein
MKLKLKTVKPELGNASVGRKNEAHIYSYLCSLTPYWMLLNCGA